MRFNPSSKLVALVAAGSVMLAPVAPPSSATTPPGATGGPAAWTTAAAPSALRVTAQSTDLLARPLGTDSVRPRLAWTLAASRRAAVQSAYQVQVASSPAALTSGSADVWDSGRVTSSNSTTVSYDGPAQTSSTRYFWRVRVWDGAGAPSTWSAATWWETGLLEDGDWQAQWIAPTTDHPGGSYLRSEVTVPDQVVRARLYVSGRGSYERGTDGQGICCEQQFGLARGIYEPWLNGTRVSDTQVESTGVDTRVRALYRSYDVTDLVHSGVNALGLMIGEDSDVLAQLRVETADGAELVLATDGSWTSAPGPVTRAHRYHGESYDARREIAGWSEPAPAGTWTAARVEDTEPGRLDAAVFQPMRVVADHAPVAVTEPTPGVYVLDFGQNRAGWTRLRADLPAGTTVTLKHGERLSDGRVDNSVIGAQQTNTYVSAGGPVDWEPSFVYAGFRWVEVTGLPEAPAGDMIVAREVHNAVPTTGSFTSSDPMLDRLHRANVQTQLNGLHAVPEDTPTREKRGWTADAHIAAEALIDNFDMAPFYENWSEESVSAQRPDGRVPDIIPTEPTTAWESRSDPAWAAAHVLIPAYLDEHYGDSSALIEHYDSLKAYVDYVATTTEDDLVVNPSTTWGNDWLAIEQTDSRLFRSGFYQWDLTVVAHAADLAGRPADAADLRARAARVAAAINREFLDRGEHSYGTSQFANAFPLTLGIVPADQVDGVVDTLVADVVSERGNHFTGGLPGIKYIPEALAMHGRSDVVLDVVINNEKPGWGYMLDNGPGTIWEDWDGASSLNHPMFTAIDSWLFDSVGGIGQAPGSVGYRRSVLAPQVMDRVADGAARLTTPYGVLASSWKRVDGRRVQLATVPVNTTAQVRVPADRALDVLEGGRPVADRPGVLSVRTRDGFVEVTVGSGSYSFTVDRVAGQLGTALAQARRLRGAIASAGVVKPGRWTLLTAQAEVAHRIERAVAAQRAQHAPRFRAQVAVALARLESLEDAVRAAGRRGQVDGPGRRSILERSAAVRAALSRLSLGGADISVTPSVVGNPTSASSFDLVVRVANSGRRTMRDAGLAVRAPRSWRVRTLRAARPTIAPGGAAVARFRVVVPAGQAPGPVDLTAALSGRLADVRVRTLSAVTVEVTSPLAITRVTADPRVLEADDDTAAVTTVVTNRSSTSLRVGARASELPDGWTHEAAPDAVVPAGATRTLVSTLTRGPEASAGGSFAVEIVSSGVVWDSARASVFVRDAGCSLDPTEEACLPGEMTLVHNFEDGVEGWVAGDGTGSVASVVSMPNGPGTARLGQRLLEASPTATALGTDWRSVSVEEPEPVAFTDADALVVYVDSYGGAPGGGPYEVRLTVSDSNGTVQEVTTTITPDSWNQVRLPLADWPGVDIAAVSVAFRASGAVPWAGKFQVDSVLLDSTPPPPDPALDLARNRPVTAKATLDCCSWSPANLVDGQRVSSAGSRGFTSDPPDSSRNSEQWVAVDLGSAQDVGSVWLWPRTATAGEPAGNGGAGFPEDFEVQVSDDGTTWDTVATYAGQTSDGSTGRGYDVGGRGRYVRILVTRLGRSAPDESTLFRVQLAELEVFAPAEH